MGAADILLAALIVDALFGEPTWIYRRVPHPAVLIGQLVGWLDHRFNRSDDRPERRRVVGIFTLIILILFCACIAVAIEVTIFAILPSFLSVVTLALIASTQLAARSLLDHVKAVRSALLSSNIEDARLALSQIVGRDTKSLDQSEIRRAAIESLAENFSDGVIAPTFWFLISGLPGIVFYKAVNTADSMIGHRSDRYREYGWAAARLDDLLNWVPARLATGLIASAAFLVKGAASANAFKAAFRDASKHVSPNAGWPEAAIAGACGLKLGGPRNYGTEAMDGAWLGDGRSDVTDHDFKRALQIVQVSWLVLLILALAYWFGVR